MTGLADSQALPIASQIDHILLYPGKSQVDQGEGSSGAGTSKRVIEEPPAEYLESKSPYTQSTGGHEHPGTLERDAQSSARSGHQGENQSLVRIKSEKSHNLINIVQSGPAEQAIEEIRIDENESPTRCTSREKRKKRLNGRSTNQ